MEAVLEFLHQFLVCFSLAVMSLVAANLVMLLKVKKEIK
jgi:hypothetical protein